MKRSLAAWLTAGTCLVALGLAPAAQAQKLGDELKKIGEAGKKAAQDAAAQAEKAAKDAASAAKKELTPPVDMNAALPTDERLVTGTLANGLSYIVVKHANPPGRAAMWIHVSSGSLNEKDNQRGIAHYLEHMAFNGSENFPPGSVVDFFQSMGLRFGQDQNAFTSFDQTTYQLAFPDTKPETIEKGMRFFSDVSGKLLLKPEEIDRERQVILEEKRTRAGGRQRILDYVLERIAPGSLVGQRLPIGVDATLTSMMRPDFVDYYDRWYVPSNMTVMVVADAAPSEMVAQINKTFSGGEKRPKPVDQDPKVSPTQGVRAVVASDKEITQTNIELMRLWPKKSPTTTIATLRRDLVAEIGTMAYNRRIGAKLNKGGTSYLSSRASGAQMFNVAYTASVDCDGEAGKWKEILAEAGTDLQRARLHGFSQRELDDVKREMISDAERFVEQESTMPAGVKMRRMNTSLSQGDTIMSAAQELDLLKKLLPTITREEVGSNFTQEFDMSSVVVVAEFPTEIPGGVPTESDVTAAANKALGVQPAAETEADRPSNLLASMPTPGKVAQQDVHEASKVVSGWLDNGVRFHFRSMDYRKNQATVNITLAGGAIQETPADRGVADAAGLAWAQPASSTLTSTNIRDIMSDKKASAKGGIGMDTMTITVAGSPSDIETGMQVAYLMLTDPLIEPAAFDRWKTRQIRGIEERKKVIDGVFLETLSTTIYPASEVRTQPLSTEQVNGQNVEKSQKWLKDHIATAPMEVTVVGDISQDQAMNLLKTYIGSLPKREKIGDSTLASLRKIERPKGPRTVEKTVDTQTDKATVAVGFYACDMENVTDRRNLQVASRIVSTRMLKLIREEEALAYSPRAGLRPGVEYPGFGTFAMITQTKPTKIPRLLEVTWNLYDDFAKDGPTSEEMDTVRKQLANELDEQMRDPQFWLGQTQTQTYRGSNLDNAVSAPEYYQKVSAGEVRATFARYYTPEAKMAVAVKPVKVVEDAPSSSEGAKKDGKPSGN